MKKINLTGLSLIALLLVCPAASHAAVLVSGASSIHYGDSIGVSGSLFLNASEAAVGCSNIPGSLVTCATAAANLSTDPVLTARARTHAHISGTAAQPFLAVAWIFVVGFAGFLGTA